MCRIECHCEFLGGSGGTCEILWINLEWRGVAFLWFDRSEIELVWVSLFVITLVLDDLNIELIVFSLIEVFLVVDFPINLKGTYSSVLNLECLCDRRRVGNDSRNRQGRWNGVVIEANLVVGHDYWTTSNIDPDWELNGW